jgi:hypothetical protein
MSLKSKSKTQSGIGVKAHRVFQDHRGTIVQIKFKAPSGQGSIGVCLSDLNGERLFRILGKCGIPLITAQAREAVSTALQQQIRGLLENGACAALPASTDFDVVPPLW